MCPHVLKHVCININLYTNSHKQNANILHVTSIQSTPRSCSLQCVDGRLHVSFLPRKRDRTGGSTLTGSPGVLTRVRAARGREWLWEAVPPLSSLSTDYEAGPRRVPLGTPQATHSLPLLCYRICRWGIRLKCEEGVCGRRAENSQYVRAYFICCLSVKFSSCYRFEEKNIVVFIVVLGLISDHSDLTCVSP